MDEPLKSGERRNRIRCYPIRCVVVDGLFWTCCNTQVDYPLVLQIDFGRCVVGGLLTQVLGRGK